jgi:hypothetical protein
LPLLPLRAVKFPPAGRAVNPSVSGWLERFTTGPGQERFEPGEARH